MSRKKKLFLALGLIGFAGVLTGTLLNKPGAVQNLSFEQQAQTSTVISGLPPSTQVSYSITSSGQKKLSGSGATNESGKLKIPAHKIDSSRMAWWAYNFEMESKKDPLRIRFEARPDKKISISGDGFEEFSNITIESTKNKIKTKTDWAGVFEESNLENANKLKIAFHGNDIFDDISKHNPLMIEVFSAEGGGGPTPDRTNEFTPSDCDYWLSTCDENSLRQQNKAVVDNYVQALMVTTYRLSEVLNYITLPIGMFFDAKMQLETQRQLQHMEAEAHKDYHPSDQMCRFGSFIKSIPRAEESASHNHQAFNAFLMPTYSNVQNTSGGTQEGSKAVAKSKREQFEQVYCDPANQNNTLGVYGICSDTETAAEKKVINKDIDYPRTLSTPLTLSVDFSDNYTSASEADVLALAKNLYWPKSFQSTIAKRLEKQPEKYMATRWLAASHNVAHNSLANLIGMKSESYSPYSDNGSGFMKALMKEFGLSDNEVNEMLGEYPSYYAQMEVLTKKIYQSPDFYTNLYDKPTNVDRISVSLDAIKLMQTRDWFDASLRREMLNSLLVEETLTTQVEILNSKIKKAVSAR